MSNQVEQLSKKELRRFSFRYAICAQACTNYETMNSCAIIYSLGPYLERIYGDDPELLKEKFNEYFQFFNCQTYFGASVAAACMSIEETKAPDATAIATALKTSLMGPLSGIGDSLFNTLPKVILCALSAYAVIKGSLLTTLIIFCIFAPLQLWLREKLIELGYYKGASIITEKQDQLNNIREAVSVLGIVVIGALIATTVKITTPIELHVGESAQSIQSILDNIFPNLLAALTTFAVYKGLNVKGMNTVRMVWVIIAVTIVLALLGIVA